MVEIVSGWHLDLERGPDWLFIRLHPPHPQGMEAPELADHLWNAIAPHFTYRVVLELDELEALYSQILGELVMLHKRLSTHDGTLRLSGMSDRNQDVLRACRLDSRFPQYRTRSDAVHGYRPTQPR